MQVRWYLKYVGGWGCQVGDVVNTWLPGPPQFLTISYKVSLLLPYNSCRLFGLGSCKHLTSWPTWHERKVPEPQDSIIIYTEGLQLNATSVKNEWLSEGIWGSTSRRCMQLMLAIDVYKDRGLRTSLCGRGAHCHLQIMSFRFLLYANCKILIAIDLKEKYSWLYWNALTLILDQGVFSSGIAFTDGFGVKPISNSWWSFPFFAMDHIKSFCTLHLVT